MRTPPPDWFPEWVPLREALDALGRAARTANQRKKTIWLRRFARQGGWLTDDDPLDSAYLAGAAAIEALRSLHDQLDLPVGTDELAEQAIEIWYLRVCEGLSTSEISAHLGHNDSWVKGRTGNHATVGGAWDGLARVNATVRIEVLAALESAPSRADEGAGRFALSQLSEDARTLAGLLSVMAPDEDIEVPLQRLRSAWHAIYPPLRDVLQDTGRLTRARSLLTRSRLVHKDGQGNQSMAEATASLIRSTLSTEQIAEYVGQAVVLAETSLDDDTANPAVWPQWEPLVVHVEAFCAAAIEAQTDLADTALLLDRLSRYKQKHHYPDQARALSKRALELATDLFGSDHPGLAFLECNLAMALSDLDDDEAALRHLNNAVHIREKRLGDGPLLAGALNMRAHVLGAIGDHRLAAADRERGIDMLLGLEGAEADLAELLHDRACTSEAGQEYAAALQDYGQVRTLVGGKYGGPEAALNEGLLLLDRKHFTEAIPSLLEAKRLLQNRYPRCSWRVWKVYDALADAYEATDEPTKSRECRQAAVDINDESARRGTAGIRLEVLRSSLPGERSLAAHDPFAMRLIHPIMDGIRFLPRGHQTDVDRP